ncbi:MAG: chemotaxis protein CheC [Candidatus Cloacimonadota bacterium]|nr:MAG: chemotaxis protein CheC [Candidatus Cloacimonadota bacterium]
MDLRKLNERQLDSIKEIANIGSGHAATALSQLTKRKVMVNVPEVKVLKVEELPSLFPEPEEVVVGILINFLGDITGRVLLVFPEKETSLLTDSLVSDEAKSNGIFNEYEQSYFKEIANIVIGAYLTALANFLGFLILPSVPALVIDNALAVLSSAHLDFSKEKDLLFCVESLFYFDEGATALHGYLLLLPDPGSLEVIFKGFNLL